MAAVQPTLTLCLALILFGCSRRDANEAPVAQAEGAGRSTQSEVPAQPVQAAAPSHPLSSALARPASELVVAIGDLHGDLAGARRALTLAWAIDAQERWVGGTMRVVQTGDLVDRGDQDREVLELLARVQREAAAAGGELLLLNGNHELMNVAADFRYVTERSFAAFAGEGGRGPAFAPGGPFAKQLAERPLFVKVGETVFVHGGILPKHVRYGLDRMNEQTQAWMRGELPVPPESVIAADGVVWTRAYATLPEPCDQLAEVLRALGAKRLVVGHTPQQSGITSGCDGRVWRIDVGISAYYGGRTEVLEIRGDLLRVRQAQ
jgi:hypothetical protein